MRFHRLSQEPEPDALAFYKIVLVRVGRHLIFTAAIHHRDALSSQAPRDCGAIDRRVARADDNNAVANRQPRLVQLAAFDGVETIDDELFAGNSELWSRTEAHAQKQRIEVCLEIRNTGFIAHTLA